MFREWVEYEPKLGNKRGLSSHGSSPPPQRPPWVVQGQGLWFEKGPGNEVLISAYQDPVFGPCVVVAFGGAPRPRFF